MWGMICCWILYISSLGAACTGPRHRDGGGGGMDLLGRRIAGWEG
jgi:hypothetical protein